MAEVLRYPSAVGRPADPGGSSSGRPRPGRATEHDPPAGPAPLMHDCIVSQKRTDVLTESPSQQARTCVLIMGMSQVTCTAGRRPTEHIPADLWHLQARPRRAGGLRDDPG